MVGQLRKYSKYIFAAAFLLLLYLTFLLIKPFAIPILASLFIAYLLFPVYEFLNSFVKNKNLTSVIMLIIIIVVVLLPLTFIINTLVDESISLYERIDVEKVTNLISKYATPKLNPYINQVAEKSLSYLVSVTSSVVFSLPQKIINSFIMLFVLFFTFRDGKEILEKFKTVLPFKKDFTKNISRRFVETLDGVVYGVITVAILQGIIAVPGFYIFEVPAPFMWGLITAIIAMLPGIGPAFVWVPIVIVKLLYGQLWAAIGLAIYSAILLTLVLDMILKPKFISKKAKMHPVIILLGVFGGLKIFGLMGLVLGPLILVMFVLFAKFYINHK